MLIVLSHHEIAGATLFKSLKISFSTSFKDFFRVMKRFVPRQTCYFVLICFLQEVLFTLLAIFQGKGFLICMQHLWMNIYLKKKKTKKSGKCMQLLVFSNVQILQKYPSVGHPTLSWNNLSAVKQAFHNTDSEET